MTKESKIQHFMETYYKGMLADISMLKPSGDVYVIFGRYKITAVNDKFIVTPISINSEHSFYDLRNAIAWCAHHIRGLCRECHDIEYLDAKLVSVVTEKTLYITKESVPHSTDLQFIYEAKLANLEFKRVTITRNLTKYINRTKNWQKSQYAKVKTY